MKTKLYLLLLLLDTQHIKPLEKKLFEIFLKLIKDYPGPESFNGNYTIYNPKESLNLTIGAPFAFFQIENCTVLVNGTSVPFITKNDYQIDYANESRIWNQFMYNRSLPTYLFFGSWILINISIPEKTYLNLEYKFHSPRHSRYIVEGYYYVIYDVGTARLWNGTITETVEINVHGNLPISVYEGQSCTISDIFDGKSYRWEWNNENIDVNYVGLYYYFNFDDYYNPLYYSIKISLISIITFLSIGSVFLKKKYRKKIIRSK